MGEHAGGRLYLSFGPMKRALVTGASGPSGRAVGVVLAELGVELHGLGRADPPVEWHGGWQSADVRDDERLDEIVRAVAPDVVFHLAATRDGELEELMAVNAHGTTALLQAVERHRPDAFVVVAGSSAEYGAVRDPGPIGEGTPLRPLTSYGASKVAAGEAALKARVAVSHTRPFNLTGPGLPDSVAPGAFARQLAEIEAGRREPVVRTGPLGATRDYVDVRDVARAWILLAERRLEGVFNVCSGRPTVVRDLLAALVDLSGLDVDVVEPTGPAEATDAPAQVGDPSRLTAATGWQAEISLERSLADLLADWRTRVVQMT
jgi:GDP-4-dehydro-6-deoxy-D-mannose reductase